MSTTAVPAETATKPRVGQLDMKLEVITIPVSDVDRSKAFYERLGWRLDADFKTGDDHVIQFTPPGSQCSVHFGTNLTSVAPGSAQSLWLIVSDIQAAREELVSRGIDVSEVFHFAGWNRIAPNARVSGPAPDRQSYASFVSFEDPDGNGWLLQEITTRLPGRVVGETTYTSTGDLMQALWRAATRSWSSSNRRGRAGAW